MHEMLWEWAGQSCPYFLLQGKLAPPKSQMKLTGSPGGHLRDDSG